MHGHVPLTHTGKPITPSIQNSGEKKPDEVLAVLKAI